jgi:hypothetical protein
VTAAARWRAVGREIRDELDALGRAVDDMREARAAAGQAPSRVVLWACGGTLHGFYTGLEKVFEIVAERVDGGSPGGPDWHRRLLRQMTVERPGLRPAVLGPETAALLDEYLAFRHRYRNLYLFDLRWEPIRELLDRAPDVWARVEGEVGRLADFLAAVTDP